MNGSNKGFQVMSEQCATCIFTQNTPISAARFLELRKAWKEQGVVQECHVATVKHQHVACRGHFDRWVNSTMPYPLNAIQKELGFDVLSKADFVQLAERMGWIQFIEMSKE